LLCVSLLPVLLLYLLRSAPDLLRSLRARPLPGAPILAIALAAFLLRALLPPLFLHVEFVGLKYWSMAMAPRLLYEQDPSFGRGGLLTQGLLATLFGGSVRAFFVGNALLSGATVALGGFLVARWAPERRIAPIATAALLALHPLLVRVGASEDVHVAAGFWALLSFVLLERHRERAAGRHGSADLFAAIAAAILATCSRQFLLPMPLLFGLLWFERCPPPRVKGRPPVWAGAGLLVATMALKWAFLLPAILSSGTGIQHGAGASAGAILRVAWFLSRFGLTEPHPLIDQWLTPLPILALMLWGLIRSGRAGLPRAVVLAWAWLFALSLPVAYWGISVGYLFRSLLVLTSLLAVGTGLGDLLVRLQRRSPRLPAVFVAGLLILTAGLAVPRIVRDAPMDPFTRQVFWWESLFPSLPEDSIIYTPSADEIGAHNLYLKIPERLLNPAGNEGRRQRPLGERWRFDDIPDAPPQYLLHGVICHAVSVFELDDDWQTPDLLLSGEDLDGLERITHSAHPGDAWIRSRRAPCRASDAPRPSADDPALDIPAVGLEYGNTFYVQEPFRIDLHRLP